MRKVTKKLPHASKSGRGKSRPNRNRSGSGDSDSDSSSDGENDRKFIHELDDRIEHEHDDNDGDHSNEHMGVWESLVLWLESSLFSLDVGQKI